VLECRANPPTAFLRPGCGLELLDRSEFITRNCDDLAPCQNDAVAKVNACSGDVPEGLVLMANEALSPPGLHQARDCPVTRLTLQLEQTPSEGARRRCWARVAAPADGLRGSAVQPGQ